MKVTATIEFWVNIDDELSKKLSDEQLKAVSHELRNRAQLALEDNVEMMDALSIGTVQSFRMGETKFER